MWLLREAISAVIFIVKAVFVFVAAVPLFSVYAGAYHVHPGHRAAFVVLVAPGCLIVFWTLYRFIFECARSARQRWEWRFSR